MFASSIAAGLVPEMLPVIVNANLARGAYMLFKRGAIVQRPDSVQSLGALSVLCSDKVKERALIIIQCLLVTDWNLN
jgi:P-type Mg2+ transporter